MKQVHFLVLLSACLICCGYADDNYTRSGFAHISPRVAFGIVGDNVDKLNAGAGVKFNTWGCYTHYKDGKYRDAGTPSIDTLKSIGAILELAVFPLNPQGFLNNDNSAAKELCGRMKTFTDAGIQVRVRWAPEANWYMNDAQYENGVPTFNMNLNQYKEGWSVVYAICKGLMGDKIKILYTPTGDSMDNWKKYAPPPSQVDMVGVDYYPNGADSSGSFGFAKTIQPFYNYFTSGDYSHVYFLLAEWGLHTKDQSQPTKLKYIKETVDAAASMPKFVSASWFNYDKSNNGDGPNDAHNYTLDTTSPAFKAILIKV